MQVPHKVIYHISSVQISWQMMWNFLQPFAFQLAVPSVFLPMIQSFMLSAYVLCHLLFVDLHQLLPPGNATRKRMQFHWICFIYRSIRFTLFYSQWNMCSHANWMIHRIKVTNDMMLSQPLAGDDRMMRQKCTNGLDRRFHFNELGFMYTHKFHKLWNCMGNC